MTIGEIMAIVRDLETKVKLLEGRAVKADRFDLDLVKKIEALEKGYWICPGCHKTFIEDGSLDRPGGCCSTRCFEKMIEKGEFRKRLESVEKNAASHEQAIGKNQKFAQDQFAGIHTCIARLQALTHVNPLTKDHIYRYDKEGKPLYGPACTCPVCNANKFTDTISEHTSDKGLKDPRGMLLASEVRLKEAEAGSLARKLLLVLKDLA